jgi:hypothetical protein
MSQSLDQRPAAGPRFTQLQGQYLAFIYAYSRIFKRPPAEADMRRHFEVTAPTVHQMVLTLEKAGLIARVPGTARSIQLPVPPEALPILRLACTKLNREPGTLGRLWDQRRYFDRTPRLHPRAALWD